MPSDGRELDRASKYDETPDFTRVLDDRRTGADEKEPGWKDQWCPGAESNHRHCDFQSLDGNPRRSSATDGVAFSQHNLLICIVSDAR